MTVDGPEGDTTESAAARIVDFFSIKMIITGTSNGQKVAEPYYYNMCTGIHEKCIKDKNGDSNTLDFLIFLCYSDTTRQIRSEIRSDIINLAKRNGIYSEIPYYRYIPFKNLLFDTEEWQPVSFSPKIIVTYCLDTIYKEPDPQIKESVMNWIEEFCDGEPGRIQCYLETVGYSMKALDRSKDEFIKRGGIMFLGETNHGKTKAIEAIGKILGSENFTKIDPRYIDATKNRFAGAGTESKLCILADDASGGSGCKLSNPDTFKKAVAGEPYIIERKGQDAKMIQPRCNWIFGYNNPPALEDEDYDAVLSRIHVFPFTHLFDPNKVMPGFYGTQDFISCLAWLGLHQGYKKLRENHRFTECEGAKRAFLHSSVTDESVREWLSRLYNTMMSPGDLNRSFADTEMEFPKAAWFDGNPTAVIYNQYKQFCYDTDSNPVSSSKLTRELRKAYPELDTYNKGNNTWAYRIR